MTAIKDKQRNTWMVKYYSKDAITGERKQVLKRGFSTKREALAWEAQQKASASTTNVTFRQLDKMYIDYKNPRKQSTRDQEESRVNKYVTFADVPVDKITKQVLLEWYVLFIKEDIATSTKNNVIGIVKAALKFGNEFYGLPNHSAVLKKLRREKKHTIYPTWTVEEFNQFIQHVEPPYQQYFLFLYSTGVRRGEAMALRAEDFKNGSVHIYHQIKYLKDGFMPLKTDSSERTIKLPPSLLSSITPLVNACGDGFVFGGEAPLTITNIQRKFTKGIEESGVKKIRIHDLRHSFATNAINNGCNIVAVSKYLGHSTIQQTLETYTHLLEKTDDAMVGIMDTVLKTCQL